MIAVRPYRPDDRAACKKIYYRAVQEGAARFYSQPHRDAWAGTPEPDLTQPDKLLDQWAFVSEENGTPTGFMSLCPDGYLDTAFVVPEVMGQGHAAALYEAVLDRAKAAKLTRLTVHASHLARRFFARRGWLVDEEQRHPYNGLIFERFAMSLDLAAIGGDRQVPARPDGDD